MKKVKKLLIVLVSVALVLSAACIFSTAETGADDLNGLVSTNIHHNDYSRWASTVKSYLYEENGSLFRAEYDSKTNAVVIETYTRSFDVLSSVSVAAELPVFGGLHIGSDGNYVVYGQNNFSDSNSLEVMRIVKYSKDWKRLNSVSVYGANTYIPFEGGSLRMTESGSSLYIYTCHEMFLTGDGLHHQANVMMIVDTDAMNITYNNCGISNIATGYASHSFNQFVAVDTLTNSVIAVDHGDAHPRSVVLFRYKNQAGLETLRAPEYISLIDIAGGSGDNITGVSVGGLAVSLDNYITVFNSIDQKKGLSETVRDVYVSVAPKNNFSSSAVKNVKLTDYASSGYTSGSPVLTELGSGKYLIMWEEKSVTSFSAYTNKIAYAIIDGNGNKLSDVRVSDGVLSDCAPILFGQKVIWYATDGSEPIFFSLNVYSPDSITIEKCGHSFTDTIIAKKTCIRDGQIQHRCDFCGYTYVETQAASGHIDSNHDSYCDICGNPIATGGNASAKWDKAVYTINDTAATVTISAPSNATLASFRINASRYNYSYTARSITFDISFYSEGVYDVYLMLSDGQVIETCFEIVDPNHTKPTDPITEPSTDPITEPSTDPITEPSTDPITEPSTDPKTEPSTVPKTESTTSEQPAVVLGDIDGNGKITAADARLALRVAARLQKCTTKQFAAADVDNNGKITASDARLILRYAAKLISSFK